MKENMLDILMYLFDHYMDEEENGAPDQDVLKTELAEAGFPVIEIDKAFRWLDGLSLLRKNSPQHFQSNHAIRVYTAQEMEKLGPECRGFLLFLEQSGTLDEINRETVIDRLMALESDEIDLDQLKWIVLMVLFNQPGQEENLAIMESLVSQEFSGVLH
ncbi:MAG: hypothetical protein A2V90_06895 [Gammaproteobacteria bacterium RBG_16_57_12]|nr:MAG: hypothetical protein A2V90_06895 [Gammaproteobacteria bacterium RBG_16_57_12]